MGCCSVKYETSYLDSVSADFKPKEDSQVLDNSNDPSIAPGLLKLLNKIPRLLEEKGWLSLTAGNINFKYKPSSIFKLEIPILHSYFSFPSKINHMKIVKLMLDPMYRLQWDCSVLEMDVVSVLGPDKMIIRTLQDQGKARLKIEKVLILNSSHKTSLIYESVGPILPNMADTKFFMMDINHEEIGTSLQITSKTEWNLNWSINDDALGYFITWVTSLYKALETNI